MTGKVHAWIGLGSNLSDPLLQLATAITELSALPGTRLTGQSPFYRSSPMGPQDQPDFVNGVALIETSLMPEALLDALQAIELRHGRERLRHWGPRTLDLDLLLYGQQVIQSERLTVPHPGVATRDFVLRPMLDLDPELTLPDGRPLGQLLATCHDNNLKRLAPTSSDSLASDTRPH